MVSRTPVREECSALSDAVRVRQLPVSRSTVNTVFDKLKSFLVNHVRRPSIPAFTSPVYSLSLVIVVTVPVLTYSHPLYEHRRSGQFFSRGLSHFCPKSISTAPEKTAMLTCKIALPDSPHPVTINQPAFRALYLARGNGFRFFSFNK